MKFLTRFFTHWTKKKVIICALTALVMAGASFGATKLFGKSGIEQISAPSDTASTKIARPIGETVEEHKNDANYNLYVAQQVLSDFAVSKRFQTVRRILSSNRRYTPVAP